MADNWTLLWVLWKFAQRWLLCVKMSQNDDGVRNLLELKKNDPLHQVAYTAIELSVCGNTVCKWNKWNEVWKISN